MFVRQDSSQKDQEAPPQLRTEYSFGSSANLSPTQEKYSDQSPLVQFANRRFFQAIHDMLGRIEIRSMLDAGCGEGEIISRLDATSIVGIDLDITRAQLARSRSPFAMLATSDVHSLPFPTESFDLVLMLEVLEHVGNPPVALEEAARVSSSYLLASVPNEPWWRIGNMLRFKYLRGFGNTPEHIHHWSSRGFRRFILGSFKILEIRQPFLWTFILAEKR